MKNRQDWLKNKHRDTSSRQAGFTVIELIIVILLVGILAKIAIPRFIDQTTTARQNTTNSLAAALAAASASNFAKRSANSSAGSAITNCNQISGLLPGNGLPSGYTITSATIAAGASVTCTLRGTNSTTQTFIGLGIS